MQTEFIDRLLTCIDCRGQFVFTAGEQIFFLDKQFKNDPKRCKPCKAKRASLGSRPAAGGPAGHLGLARTETRTECSECHIETTVPFKPTQGRPVLCRQCFQGKRGSLTLDPPPQTTASATAVRFDLAAGAAESIAESLVPTHA
jgi:CxxC-x17-CxxC domain-containing protein